MADANRLLRARDLVHLSALGDALNAGGNASAQLNDAQHSVSSRFFEVDGMLQLEQTTVYEHSVVQRDGMEVKTLWRQRGVLPPPAPLQ
jgi:general secretion pathway protein K